jgi:hypothetical protein
LHLLAAEPAAHPETLDGDLVVVPAEHVRHDLLRFGRVLRAALHEDLPGLIDHRQRGVGFEVEVLLAGEFELSAEDVRAVRQRRLDVAPLHVRLGALECAGGDRLAHGHERRQRVYVHLDGDGSEPGGLEGLAEHPAHRVAVEHDLVREQGLVVLDAGIVDPGNIRGGQHPHDTGHE